MPRRLPAAAYGVALFLLAVGYAAAQGSGSTQSAPAAAAPALPVEALKFGDDLQGHATAGFLKWARGYAEKEMHEQRVDPKAVMAVVDKRYTGTSDVARDCGIFLVFHLAYRDEEARVSLLEGEIREIDRETYDITRELQLMYETEQNRVGGTRGPLGAGERMAQNDQVNKKNQRLRDLREKKIELGKQVQAGRKKINQYLKVQAVTHDRMKGIAANAIRELQ